MNCREDINSNQSRKLICIITDGGQDVGMGHVVQSITLAHYLKTHADIVFLTRSALSVSKIIEESGYFVHALNSEPNILDCLKLLKPDVVVIDYFDVSEWLARNIRAFFDTRLVISTNMSLANRYADMVVRPHLMSSKLHNDGATKFFDGPKYWILRPEFFLKQKIGSKESIIQVRRILLIFGGSDPSNLTCETLKNLAKIERNFEIDVIVGGQFAFNMDLDNFRHKENITVYSGASNIAELLYNADLVITSPGLSAFEALRVGTPIILLCHNTLQEETYTFMRITHRGDLVSLAAMIDRLDFIFPSETCIRQMQIGEGVDDVVKEILHLARNKAS